MPGGPGKVAKRSKTEKNGGFTRKTREFSKPDEIFATPNEITNCQDTRPAVDMIIRLPEGRRSLPARRQSHQVEKATALATECQSAKMRGKIAGKLEFKMVGCKNLANVVYLPELIMLVT